MIEVRGSARYPPFCILLTWRQKQWVSGMWILLHVVTMEKFLLIKVLLFMSGCILQFRSSVKRFNEIFCLFSIITANCAWRSTPHFTVLLWHLPGEVKQTMCKISCLELLSALLFYCSSLKGEEVGLWDYHAVSVLLWGSVDNINCESPHFSVWLLFCIQMWVTIWVFQNIVL